MNSGVTPIRRVCLGVALAASISACTGERSQSADTAAPAAAAETGAAPAASTSPVDKIPAAAITAALNNPARWQQFPAEAERLCKGTADCNNGVARTKVRLWSYVGTRTLGYPSAADTAILIGKIQNLGSFSTRRYNLESGRIYAIYMMMNVAGGRYEIWEAQGQNKSMVASGVYHPCQHEERKYPFSFAVFTDCDHPPKLATSQRGPGLAWSPTGTGATHDDGPAWFTCTSGCCTADPE